MVCRPSRNIIDHVTRATWGERISLINERSTTSAALSPRSAISRDDQQAFSPHSLYSILTANPLSSYPASHYEQTILASNGPKHYSSGMRANTSLSFEMIKALCSSEQAYEVLVGGRSLVNAEQAANAVKRGFPSTRSRAWPVQIDIEDDEPIQTIFEEVQTKFGRLDALVNNAGTNAGEYRE